MIRSDSRTRFGGERWWLWGLLALALLVRLPWLDAELDDLDSWRQTDTATIARNFLEEPRLLWPRINWGAPGPGYVEAELQLFPYATHLLYRTFGQDPRLGRGLSILLSLLSCWVFYRLARRLLGDGSGGEAEAGAAPALLALTIFALAPLSIRYGRSFMPEATVLLFYLLAALAFFGRYPDRRALALAPAGGWMALAILVKPTSLHLGLILALWALDRDGPRMLRDRRLWIFAALALVPPALYYAHAAGIYQRYGNTFGLLSGGDVKWGHPSWWLQPWLYSSLVRIEARWIAGHGGLLLAGAGLVAELLRRRPGQRERGWIRLGRPSPGVLVFAAVTLLLYYLIVARYAGSEARGVQYHLYAVPWLAMAMARGASWLWALGRQRKTFAGMALPAAAGPALVTVLLATMVLQMVPHWQKVYFYRDPPLLRRAAAAVAELTDPWETILVLSNSPSSDAGVANNYQQPQVFFHAGRRGRSLAKDRQTREELEAALADGIPWLVTFDRHLSDDPEFRAALAELYRPSLEDEGFALYRAAGEAAIETAPRAADGAARLRRVPTAGGSRPRG